MGSLGFLVWANDNRGRLDAVRVDASSESDAARQWYAKWRADRSNTTSPQEVTVERLGSGARSAWSLRVVDPVICERMPS